MANESDKASRRATTKVLFILLGTPRKASSRVRGYWIADEMRSWGYSCRIVHRASVAGLLRTFVLIVWADAVVLQKRISTWHYWLVRWARLLGRCTVLDLDDKVSRIDHPRTERNARRILARVSAVTVGSGPLYCFASKYNDRVTLVPSGVRLRGYPQRVPGEAQPVTLGWIGNGREYADDLVKVLLPGLHGLDTRLAWRLRIVGGCSSGKLQSAFSENGRFPCEIVEDIDWSDESAVARELATFDIGLYPLLDNTYNRFKCGFKAIEYMATGLPVIASPVGELANIVVHGQTGLFANGCDDWKDGLHSLIDDASLRVRMGAAGRARVERLYDVRDSAKCMATVIRGLVK